MKLQQLHSSDITGQNTKLPLRVKNKKLKDIYWCGKTFTQREKNREFKAKVHDPHVLQDQNNP